MLARPHPAPALVITEGIKCRAHACCMLWQGWTCEPMKPGNSPHQLAHLRAPQPRGWCLRVWVWACVHAHGFAVAPGSQWACGCVHLVQACKGTPTHSRLLLRRGPELGGDGLPLSPSWPASACVCVVVCVVVVCVCCGSVAGGSGRGHCTRAGQGSGASLPPCLLPVCLYAACVRACMLTHLSSAGGGGPCCALCCV